MALMTGSEQHVILDVQGLSKTYKTFKKNAGLKASILGFFKRDVIEVSAVKPISFQISKGEFVGLLGPNGAGKTTTLKMLTGLIPPTAGTSTAFQQYNTRERDHQYLKRIGMVMGQRNQLHADLPALDSFKLAKAIYDIDDARYHKRLKECLDLFEIHSKVDVPVRKLSLGERMKMELILAIIHEPELLFLDEPTIGLDFNAAKQIRAFLKKANQELGITVILTSHYTKDIEELCKRVIVINHGRIVYDGKLAGLDERLYGEKVLRFKFDLSQGVEDAEKSIGSTLNTKVERRSLDQNTVELLCPAPNKAVVSAMKTFSSEQWFAKVSDLIIEERNLEDIFAEIYSAAASGVK